MVMIIIHIAYITCLVTNDAWPAYGVIVVYKIHHTAELAMLWLADTLIGEDAARSI